MSDYSKAYKKKDGGVCAANGFKASACMAGIKYKDRADMALVYSEADAVSAGTFTTNIVKAAPVVWDMDIIKNYGKARAAVLNSGIANACTGEDGVKDNEVMAGAMAQELGLKSEEVFTLSTGVIGYRLNMDAIKKGVVKLKDALGAEAKDATAAAQAIMTTDTVKKECAVSFEMEGKTVSIGGMCKGSGMIHPNMATMLSVITTDACISFELLDKIIHEAVFKSFNMVSVDRDTSTNDTCLIMANGMSGAPEITEGSEAYEVFKESVFAICKELAMDIAADGEGATKLIEVNAVNVADYEDARVLAKAVITSNLVKAAVYGSDANAGRIMSSIGASGVVFDPTKTDVFVDDPEFGQLYLIRDGEFLSFDEDKATAALKREKVVIYLDMKSGSEKATAWGCDLTHEYVNINADYRS